MIFNCPYCNTTKDNWKAIRAHTSSCSSNTGEYHINLTIDPIHYLDCVYNHKNLQAQGIKLYDAVKMFKSK